MNLLAKAATFTDDGYCSLLSLADDPMNPQHYVMLAFTNEPDEQDASMGMSGVHVDLGAWQVDGYSLIENVTYDGRIISIQIKKQAADKAGIDEKIDVVLENDDLGVPVSDIVAKFRERLALAA
jgi:hypothetical protein